jgi:hypothetical protein
MSTLSVSNITSPTNTTPLVLSSANSQAAFVRVEAANDDIIFGGTTKFLGTLSASYIQSDSINAAFGVANASYNTANTVSGNTVAASFNTSNAAYGFTNSAYASINSNWTVQNAAYSVSNAAFSRANGIFSINTLTAQYSIIDFDITFGSVGQLSLTGVGNANRLISLNNYNAGGKAGVVVLKVNREPNNSVTLSYVTDGSSGANVYFKNDIQFPFTANNGTSNVSDVHIFYTDGSDFYGIAYSGTHASINSNWATTNAAYNTANAAYANSNTKVTTGKSIAMAIVFS